MGVRGLTKFLVDRQKARDGAAGQLVVLSDLARQDTVTLLCDGYGLLFHLIEDIELPHMGLAATMRGFYHELDERIESFCTLLVEAGINVQVLFDPGRGTSADRRKEVEWKQRQLQNFALLADLEAFCSAADGDEFAVSPEELLMLPHLCRDQALATFRRLNIYTETCHDEADEEIIRRLLRLRTEGHEHVFVASGDSDFFVLQNSVFIPFQMLTVTDTAITGIVFTPEYTARVLGLGLPRLPELAAACGNDITGALVHNAEAYRFFTAKRGVGPLVEFLQQLPSEQRLMDTEQFQTAQDALPELAGLFQQSLQFYQLTNPATEFVSEQAYLANEMRHGLMPSFSLAVSLHGQYWVPMYFEPVAAAAIRKDDRGKAEGLAIPGRVNGYTSVASILRPLRACFYGLLGRASVVEHVRHGYQLVDVTVKAMPTKPLQGVCDVAALHQLRQSTDETQRWLVAVSAVEASLPTCKPLRHPSKQEGALFVVLQVFAGACRRAGNVTLQDFCAVSAMVSLGRQGRARLQGSHGKLLRRRPSLHSVYVASLFQGCVGGWNNLCALLGLSMSLEPVDTFDDQVFAALTWLVDTLSGGPDKFHANAVENICGGTLPPLYHTALTLQAVKRLPVLPGRRSPLPQAAAARANTTAALANTAAATANIAAASQVQAAQAVPHVLPAASSPAGFTQSAVAQQHPAGIEQQPQQQPVTTSQQEQQPKQKASLDGLPVMDHQEEICQLVNDHRVLVIEGETGCGKSSGLPVILYQEARHRQKRVKILVTQPRRIAATSLARRVASVFDEPVGQTVGYWVSMDKVSSRKTQIIYATVGFALQAFTHDHSRLAGFTHLVLDEVHERSIDNDMLLLLLRLTLQLYDIKLVIMSATLQHDVFEEYFDFADPLGVPSLFVGARRFPVQELTLDGFGQYFGQNIGRMAQKLRLKFDLMASNPYDPKPQVTPEAEALCVALVTRVRAPGECILIFLPGYAEILNLHEKLETMPNIVTHLLHSQITLEDPEAVFLPPPEGFTKVVLATNMAESSITIPDVIHVIDFGMQRGMRVDPRRRISILGLSYCSKAACAQRSGRAGRLQPGTCFRLFSEAFYENKMPRFDTAEMLRMSLDKVVLSTILLMDQFALSVHELLALVVDPPGDDRVDAAIENLKGCGALTADLEVTEFGEVAAHIPADLSLAQLLAAGVSVGQACDSVLLAAALSAQDPFFTPANFNGQMPFEEFALKLKSNIHARLGHDGNQCSEPLGVRAVLLDYLHSDRSKRWCVLHDVSYVRMRSLAQTVHHLCRCLLDLSLLTAEQQGEVSSLMAAMRDRSRMTAAVTATLATEPTALLFLMMASFWKHALFSAAPNAKHVKHMRSAQIKDPADLRRVLRIHSLPPEYKQPDAVKDLLVRCKLPVSSIVQDKATMYVTFEPTDDQLDQAAGMPGLLNPLAMTCSMLSCGWFKLRLPNPHYKPAIPGSRQTVQRTVDLPLPSPLAPISWMTFADGAKAKLAWRSVVCGAVDTDLGEVTRVAIAHSIIGTDREDLVRAGGVTVLPELVALLGTLVFSSSNETVALTGLVDKGMFLSVRLPKCRLTLPDELYLSLKDLQAINDIRGVLSHIAVYPGGESVARGCQALRSFTDLLRRVQTQKFDLPENIEGDVDDVDALAQALQETTIAMPSATLEDGEPVLYPPYDLRIRPSSTRDSAKGSSKKKSKKDQAAASQPPAGSQQPQPGSKAAQRKQPGKKKQGKRPTKDDKKSRTKARKAKHKDF
eukprot:m.331977 g.331977  ORF g.331977 m.331977 type:complete len:1754 (-) comp19774_c0_seq2:46-5307(-)